MLMGYTEEEACDPTQTGAPYSAPVNRMKGVVTSGDGAWSHQEMGRGHMRDGNTK